MIRAVFFDIDDTLLDFSVSAMSAMASCFRDCGLPFREEMFTDGFLPVNRGLWKEIEAGTLTKDGLYEVRWNRVFDRIGIDFDGQAFEKLFLDRLESTAVPTEGAPDVLKRISSLCPVYAGSNAPQLQQERRLRASGLLPCLTGVITSELAGVEKPAPGFFRVCAERARCEPEEILFVGDSLSADILGAGNAGMKTCWYNPTGKPVPEGIRPDAVITMLREAEKLVSPGSEFNHQD